jgi:hypothetical protein
MKKYNHDRGMPFNPKDETIWYNQPELKEKVEKIKKKFGEPFLITKDGMMLYEDSLVIPCFRDNQPNEQIYE